MSQRRCGYCGGTPKPSVEKVPGEPCFFCTDGCRSGAKQFGIGLFDEGGIVIGTAPYTNESTH